MTRILLVLMALAGCRSLDRSTKNACNTAADCVAIGAQCVKNVCQGGIFGTTSSSIDPAPTGPTGPTGCRESSQCKAKEVCNDGKCEAMIERDYEQTRSALRRVVCDTLNDLCGNRFDQKYQSITACYNASEAPLGIELGPAGVSISSWNAEYAARCVADTRMMLTRGLERRSFAAMPDSCTHVGYGDGSFGCTNQIDCYTGYTCSRPPSGVGTGTWICIPHRADFGEGCYNPEEALPQSIEDSCTDGLYCDMRSSGTCKRRIEPGKPCLTQYFTHSDNDPLFDPCTSGYMCSESSGTCEPFVALCPL